MVSQENGCALELSSRAGEALKRVAEARSLQTEVERVLIHEVINLIECLIIAVPNEKRYQAAVPGRLPSPSFRPISRDPDFII